MTEIITRELSRNSSSGGVVKVVLSGGTGRGNNGESLSCTSCKIRVQDGSGIVRMNVGEEADGNSFPLYDKEELSPIDYEIDDVSKLYFYSETADAIVYIIYRN